MPFLTLSSFLQIFAPLFCRQVTLRIFRCTSMSGTISTKIGQLVNLGMCLLCALCSFFRMRIGVCFIVVSFSRLGSFGNFLALILSPLSSVEKLNENNGNKTKQNQRNLIYLSMDLLGP